MEENIFSNEPSSSQSCDESPSDMNSISALELINDIPVTSILQMRPRAILSKVEAEQNKWKNTVEEQRRNVLQNHMILN